MDSMVLAHTGTALEITSRTPSTRARGRHWFLAICCKTPTSPDKYPQFEFYNGNPRQVSPKTATYATSGDIQLTTLPLLTAEEQETVEARCLVGCTCPRFSQSTRNCHCEIRVVWVRANAVMHRVSDTYFVGIYPTHATAQRGLAKLNEAFGEPKAVLEQVVDPLIILEEPPPLALVPAPPEPPVPDPEEDSEIAEAPTEVILLTPLQESDGTNAVAEEDTTEPLEPPTEMLNPVPVPEEPPLEVPKAEEHPPAPTPAPAKSATKQEGNKRQKSKKRNKPKKKSRTPAGILYLVIVTHEGVDVVPCSGRKRLHRGSRQYTRVGNRIMMRDTGMVKFSLTAGRTHHTDPLTFSATYHGVFENRQAAEAWGEQKLPKIQAERSALAS